MLVSSIAATIITVFSILSIIPAGFTDITLVLSAVVIAPATALLGWFISALVIHAIASYAFRLRADLRTWHFSGH